ncbi:aminoglycoside phosphotransferase family protein [Acidimangrovimonas pyrenivorans]|uniref:Aminoglycoside phosphotransferase family protein n=1 Tax=Acidimangrovimonas pyrenivorans TaxID=2030798 RepID=A0ABV7AKQ1_9RHOB
MPDRAALSAAFLEAAGWGDAARAFLAGDASARSYDRLTRGDKTAVLMDAPPEGGVDVGAFARIARHLRTLELSAPRILAEDIGNGLLLVEDLGDDIYARIIERFPAREYPLYSAATDLIGFLQSQPAPAGLPVYDSAKMGEAVSPIAEFYAATVTGTAQDPAPLQSAMTAALARLAPGADVMLLRDYHAENLIWLPQRDGIEKVGLLDFELACMGHPAYDLVSLLQDARRDVSEETEEAMIWRFTGFTKRDLEPFQAAYAAQGAQRNLRIVGIFARLALRDGKTRYLSMIPRVWGYVQRNLAHPELAELAELVAQTVPEPTPEALQGIADRCPT